jgi:hypothetical protein
LQQHAHEVLTAVKGAGNPFTVQRRERRTLAAEARVNHAVGFTPTEGYTLAQQRILYTSAHVSRFLVS